ncbi:CbtA family protein [Sneathiella chinensis]|uniref:Cobalt transporter n=1 Tax=Sneathiella chinensis TaxID=349750 RepID=A0ABQ5U1D5_9PROT|nr:CbtA family protein [Sneathiella chinensis]GLQ05959.1 hypothetical protein GCM10007924_11800 [Sneathiella chinensis]
MIVRFLWVGIMAGILAGLPAAAIQHFTTTPLIIAAENYEGDAPAESHAGLHLNGMSVQTELGKGILLAHAGGDHSHDSVWAPENGWERTFFTSVSTVVTTIGYALMLLAVMFLAKSRITPRTGLIWGIAGFTVAGLAPALGLSPELPGSAAADLMARQLWWGMTAVATGAGLWLIFQTSKGWSIVAGIVLLALPHLIGAPHPDELSSGVPSEIAAHFAASALVVHAITWALVGASVGLLWQRNTPSDA